MIRAIQVHYELEGRQYFLANNELGARYFPGWISALVFLVFHLFVVSLSFANQPDPPLAVFDSLEQRISGCGLILIGKIHNRTPFKKDGIVWRSALTIQASRVIGESSQHGDFRGYLAFLSSWTHWNLDEMFAEEVGIAIRRSVAAKVNDRLAGFPWEDAKPKLDSIFLLRSHKGKWVVADVFREPKECVAVEALARIIHKGQWKTQAPIVFAGDAPYDIQLATVRWVGENGGKSGIAINALEKSLRQLPVERSAKLLDEGIRHLARILINDHGTTRLLNPKLPRLGELLELAPPISESTCDELETLAHNLALDEAPAAIANRKKFVNGLREQIRRANSEKVRSKLGLMLEGLTPKPASPK